SGAGQAPVVPVGRFQALPVQRAGACPGPEAGRRAQAALPGLWSRGGPVQPGAGPRIDRRKAVRAALGADAARPRAGTAAGGAWAGRQGQALRSPERIPDRGERHGPLSPSRRRTTTEQPSRTAVPMSVMGPTAGTTTRRQVEILLLVREHGRGHSRSLLVPCG